MTVLRPPHAHATTPNRPPKQRSSAHSVHLRWRPATTGSSLSSGVAGATRGRHGRAGATTPWCPATGAPCTVAPLSTRPCATGPTVRRPAGRRRPPRRARPSRRSEPPDPAVTPCPTRAIRAQGKGGHQGARPALLVLAGDTAPPVECGRHQEALHCVRAGCAHRRYRMARRCVLRAARPSRHPTRARPVRERCPPSRGARPFLRVPPASTPRCRVLRAHPLRRVQAPWSRPVTRAR